MKPKLFTIIILSFFAPSLFAQEEAPGTLSRMFAITPKAAMDEQFQRAFEEHVKWRAENGDPWSWNTYHQVLGNDLDSFFIRSSGHKWVDLDAYNAFNAKAIEHWNANVHPYVEKVTSSMDEVNTEVLHWPEDDSDLAYFWVYEYHLKSGHTDAFYKAVKAIHEKVRAADWPQYYAFVTHLTGEDLPAVSLVIPKKDMGGFASPEKGPMEVIAESSGEKTAKKLFDDLFATIDTTHSAVYHLHKEWSVEAAE